MKNISVLSTFFRHLVAGIMIVCVLPASGKDYFVSVDGNDQADGSVSAPFAHVERALQAVLEDNEKQSETTYTISLGEGIFFLEKTLELDAKDLSGAILTVKGKGTGSTILSGGIRIQGWEKIDNNLWSAPTRDIPVFFRELFVGSQRATRARHPNQSFLRVKKAGSDRRTYFTYSKGDFPMPENAGGMELVLLHDWSVSRNQVKDIDMKSGTLFSKDSIGASSPGFFHIDNWEAHPRYFLENDKAFLDMEYEWFNDRISGKLYLKLPEGIDPNRTPVYAPVLDQLVHLHGNEETAIKNIGFKNLTFSHCRWDLPGKGYGGVQACFHDARPEEGWKPVSAAIKLEWAMNCSFNNCSFSHLGNTGIWLATACYQCSVVDCSVYDVSANGIMVGEGRERTVKGEVWWKSRPDQVALANRIERCKITGVGQQFYGAVGIWCGFVAETVIKENELSDLPYSGISIGWEWSPIPTPCRDNTVDGNHIHQILNILSDGGGIYMLGLQPGSKLVNNSIHDVKINAGRAESNGMFLDEGTTDVLVANNLIYNIAKSPLRFHKASVNRVKDNYLFCQNGNPPIRYNRTNEEDILKENNRVFMDGDTGYAEALEEAVQRYE